VGKQISKNKWVRENGKEVGKRGLTSLGKFLGLTKGTKKDLSELFDENADENADEMGFTDNIESALGAIPDDFKKKKDFLRAYEDVVSTVGREAKRALDDLTDDNSRHDFESHFNTIDECVRKAYEGNKDGFDIFVGVLEKLEKESQGRSSSSSVTVTVTNNSCGVGGSVKATGIESVAIGGHYTGRLNTGTQYRNAEAENLSPVLSWLRDLEISSEDCDRYAKALKAQGYDTLESIGELSKDELLNDFQIKKGHVNRILQQCIGGLNITFGSTPGDSGISSHNNADNNHNSLCDSLNEEQTRDLGEFEDQIFIPNGQDFENESLVSDEAKFRSIPMGGGPLDLDMGNMYEAHVPPKVSSLQQAFAQQRPDLVPRNKQIFNIVEASSTPPSLDKDMCCVISKKIVFCKAANINQVTASVRSVVDEHDCFEWVADKDPHPGFSGPEESEWVWNLTHYSREKFSIDLNVNFWALDDMESIRTSFRACPEDANFAVEFQRLGGDSFAWMDLWADMLAGVEMRSQETMQFTRNAKPVKRRCLNIDLLSDSEDDEGDDDVGSSLTMLMVMWETNGLEGQLEALKAMCRMSENLGQCKLMAKNATFISFVAKMAVDLHAKCLKSSRPVPLLRCIISLIMSLLSTAGEKENLGTSEEVMGVVASLLEDSTCCQAVRYECSKLVLFMITQGIEFAEKECVLAAVDAAKRESNGKKLNETLTQIQNRVRSLSYR